MKVPGTISELWVWWDLISIPQRNCGKQKAAIHSLCYYASLCSRFLPLVRDEVEWATLYKENINVDGRATAGTLTAYAARGWCRLEIVSGLAPKRFSSGSWRPGPRNVRYFYHHDPMQAGAGPLLTKAALRNPLYGIFTDDDDRDRIMPVLKAIAMRYAEYAASGSDAWDSTLDVHNRPQWLKSLACITRGTRESAVVDPNRAEFADLARPYRPALVNPATEEEQEEEGESADPTRDVEPWAVMASSTRPAATVHPMPCP